jgi:hypothetical protein
MELSTNKIMSLIKRDWILYKKYYYLAAIILIAICIFVMLLISDEANVNTPPDAPEIIFFRSVQSIH